MRTESPHAAPVTGSDEHHYLSHREIVIVLFGLMAGVLLAALDQSIVGTACPASSAS